MNKVVQNLGENRNEMGVHTNAVRYIDAIVKYYMP
jgi:hypothetical protein